MGFVPTYASSCSTLTFPTKCKKCTAPTFFFSCSCGSAVLFDELGGYWPVHDCERAETEAGLKRARHIIEDGRDAASGSHRPFEGLHDLIDVDGLPDGERRQVEVITGKVKAPATLRPEHAIKPMDPTADGEEHFFIGLMTERESGTARIKRLYAEVGGLGLKMLGLPAQSQAVQITMVDAGGEPNESYTAIADRGRLEGGAQPGKLVGVSLVGRVASGYRFWLVTDLQVL
ncbi:hypothetical protein RM53_10335 [Brevundimonas nasdae]|uniref:Uncharacterized protein n=1 Tax=Brevundimonas nasdae TaxID=172043 RepID=A0A0B4CRG9_9CAUL|nr:hypothetical protein [Brevundimonas nasdae]KIC56986.1 hypothetical protein RM53_10335 [Brevundimonas nasdae]